MFLGQNLKSPKLNTVIDNRLKALNKVACPNLVTKIINKEVSVQEKDTYELNLEGKVQKYISKNSQITCNRLTRKVIFWAKEKL